VASRSISPAFAVADAFDAITNNRPCKARPVAAAVAEIERGAGSQFDPAVVSAFVPLACQLESDLSP
jgi:HD-GYP domain-containing protein (c-di-GMP phosphodiesterase class II)